MLSLDQRYANWLRSPALPAAAAVVVGAVYGVALAYDLSPLLLLAAPAGLALLIAACVRPDLATVLLVVIEWGYLSDIGVLYHGLPSTSKPLAVLLLVVLIVRRIIGRPRGMVYDAMLWWWMAYLFVTALGLWYAPAPDRTMARLIELVKQFVQFLLIINFVRRAETFRLMMWLLLLLGALLGTLTVFQEITHSYNNNFGGLARMEISTIAEGFSIRPRAGGSTSSPLAYGQQLIVVLPVGLWGILHGRNLMQRAVALYCSAACLAGIGLCFSRSTYLATAVMLGLYALHIRVKPRYLLATIPLIVIMLAIAPPEFGARVGTLGNLLPGEDKEGLRSEPSFNRRSVEMLMAVEMFIDHPIIGVGAENYPALYQHYIRQTGSPVEDDQRSPHSYYLEVAAETGLIGLTIWGGVVLLTWRKQRAARHDFAAAGGPRMAELAAAVEFGFIGYLATALLYHAAYMHYFWLQVAWGTALALIARRTLQSASVVGRDAII